MSISDQFFENCPSTNGTEFVQICAWIDVCETSKIIKKRDMYYAFEGLAALDYVEF